MFSRLKNKLKAWTKNVSKEKEIKEDKNISNKARQEIKETNKKQKKESSGRKSKKEKTNKEKTKQTSGKKEIKEVNKEKTKIKQTPKKQETEEKEKQEFLEEEIKPETKEKEFPEKKESFFQKITQKTSNTKITEEEFEKYKEELEMILLENNVALEAVENITSKVKSDIVGIPIPKKEILQKINESLKKNITEILIEPFDLIKKIKEFKFLEKDKPYVILFCGINGSGKTTGIAKLTYKFQKNNLSCVLGAADTFRAASIEQLKIHAENLNVKTISHEYGSDPAAVGFDAIKYAEKNKKDVVLIDTAGRMHTEKNLIQEIEKISRVCKPNLKIFVGESITGNDATEQAKSFNNAIGIDAIILTKADIDEKAGAVLSVGQITGKPIIYLGTGQNYKDLESFNKEKFIQKLGF
ncbi:MAG: signal recognition particle-docking protein FtsY [Nanoarchaeota archaeon]